ncbi:T9SS type A sorting domain-containing protein [Flavobacterium sp.]|uniref:T9SS type A sorting domain-containing protein n=1 Tax=Flavobacterium sp. TaxID=239 RepID=UPI0039E5CFB3
MKAKYNFLYILLLLLFTSSIQAQCFTKISSGEGHIVAIKSDGTFWTWGSNNGWQMGNENFIPELSPIQLNTSNNWIFGIAGKVNNTFMIRNDNTLWGLGQNTYGILGIGNSTPALSSFNQIGNATWKHISSTFHTYAIRTNGTLWGWGQNDGGQMGNGTCCSNQLSPVQIGTDSDWRQVEASQTRSGLAIKENGTLWGWGSNGSRLVATPSTSIVNFPTQIGTDVDWEYISVGASHCLALKTDGTLWSWGTNGYGQNGTGSNSNIPQQVGTDTWIYASAGFLSSFGIKSDNTLWAWGRNDQSELGDGTTIQHNAPVQIGTETNWVAVAAGTFYAVALKSDGSLWAWGNNQNGQYGNGTTATSPIPLYIPVEGCTLSVSDFQQVPVVIAPNPAKERTTLHFKNSLEKVTLSVYDFSGKIIISQEIDGLNEYHLNTSDYPVGVYLVEVKENGKLVGNYKLVKE